MRAVLQHGIREVQLAELPEPKPGPVLTHRFPVERAREAFDLAERKAEGAVRVAVTFD